MTIRKFAILFLAAAGTAAVRSWLVDYGVVAVGTSVNGYGRAKPIAPNRKPDGSDDPAGRARNRRVEIVIDTCR